MSRKLSDIEQRAGTLKAKVVAVTALLHRPPSVTESFVLPPPLRDASCKNPISCLTAAFGITVRLRLLRKPARCRWEIGDARRLEKRGVCALPLRLTDGWQLNRVYAAYLPYQACERP